MTTTRRIRARVAAGAAALFIAVFSVLWSQAPATTAQTAQTSTAQHHNPAASLSTRTS
jgi:hypothetical protein